MAVSKKNVVWSFFSGAMGLDLGFEQNGIGPTLVVERSADCRKTIRLNRGDEIQLGTE